jgi:hypothetical protein
MKQAYSATMTLKSVLTHHLTQPTLRGLDQDGEERWKAILHKVRDLAGPVIAEVEQIFNDPKLTDQGKEDKLLAVGPRVVGNFKNVGIVLNEAEQAKARLERLVFDPLTTKPAGNEMVVGLREYEIRQDIGKPQAGAAFLDAVDKGHIETARAILDWPGGPVLPKEIRRRGMAAFAQRTQPDIWRKVQFVEALHERLSALGSSIARWLLELGASPDSVQAATKIPVTRPSTVTQLNEYLAQTNQADATTE